jgi:hypothetical protein
MDTCYDWTYEQLLDVTSEFLMREYTCTPEEASEAMEYIESFLKDVEKDFPFLH